MANQRSPPYVDFQAGSGTTNGSGDATVSFPHSFSGVPKIFLQGIDSGAKGIVLDVVSRTATGFVAKARKVTGITTGSGLGSHSHTVNSHTHGIGSPTTQNYGITGIHGVYVASSTHTHTRSVMGGPSTKNWVIGDLTRGSCPLGHTNCVVSSVVGLEVASKTHTHTFTTTGPSTTTNVVDGYYATSVVTGIPSGTGSRSPGTSSVNLAHTHSVGAPALSISFDWLSILA